MNEKLIDEKIPVDRKLGIVYLVEYSKCASFYD